MKRFGHGTRYVTGQVHRKKNVEPVPAVPGTVGKRFDWLQQDLDRLKEKNLYRKFRVLEHLKGTSATIEGKPVSLFCGNDYLGLSQHPKLIEAAKRALETHGIGVGSARLISGTSEWHAALENRIAAFLGKEKALLFSSGYLANLGALSALTHETDTIILDKLCHASLIDAAKLSGATVRIYPHGNLEYLEKLLKLSVPGTAGTGSPNPPNLSRNVPGTEGKGRRTWIVTDSIFSMDGDLAPLPELVKLKNRYDAYLVIDEAHGTGVFGKNGRGVSEHLGVSDEIDVHIGTLSKAIGTVGGFVAGGGELIDYLINHARTFIFETALPAPVCAAAIQAFDLIEQEAPLTLPPQRWRIRPLAETLSPEGRGEGEGMRKRLWRNVKKLRSKLQETGASILEGDSPIIPVVFGDEKKALNAAEFLLARGFLIPAVRYPTVPKGKARLRMTVSSGHSENDIDRLVNTFKQLLPMADERKTKEAVL